MAEKHFMSEVLQMVIDGTTVQMKDNGHWVDSSPDAVLRSIANRNRGREGYRAKPPVFVLNGTEIGLPLTAEQADECKLALYIPSLAGENDYITVTDKKCDMYRKALDKRMLFMNCDDAKKVSRALQDILFAAVPATR